MVFAGDLVIVLRLLLELVLRVFGTAATISLILSQSGRVLPAVNGRQYTDQAFAAGLVLFAVLILEVPSFLVLRALDAALLRHGESETASKAVRERRGRGACQAFRSWLRCRGG